MLRCEKCRHEDVSAKKYPCSKCDSVTNDLFEPKKQTNADRIRSMSDEELVEFFLEKMDCAACPASEDVACEHDRCLENIKEWLEREAEE